MIAGEKINEARGRILGSNKVVIPPDGHARIAQMVEDFKSFMPRMGRTKKPVLHIDKHLEWLVCYDLLDESSLYGLAGSLHHALQCVIFKVIKPHHDAMRAGVGRLGSPGGGKSP